MGKVGLHLYDNLVVTAIDIFLPFFYRILIKSCLILSHLIVGEYSRCSVEVKCLLFTIYCSN